MTKALILFRQAYARDLARELLAQVDWMNVCGVVGSIGEMSALLDAEQVDLLIIGPTFIERVEAFLDARPDCKQPVVVVLDRAAELSIRLRAAAHRIDKVVSAAQGLDVMLDELKKCATNPDDCRRSRDTVPLEVTSHTIFVADEVDREIVRLVAAGFADREIADVVNYSHQTVRNRISRILGETGARNRTHLACMYLTLVHDGLMPFETV